MEFDLSFNFVSIFVTILLILAVTITVFQKLKLRWPVKVNCWFCNTNTKIWRQQLNWWLCPHCEQYNGFSKNGDYSYNIPEQYKTPSKEIKRYCLDNQGKQTNKVPTNGLCDQCNANESIKLLKLSNYKPLNEKNYEYEIKQFKNALEQQYSLCASCNTTVYNVLHRQALWLAEYKMLLFKQKPFNAIAKNAKYSEPIFRVISTVLDSIMVYNMDFILLPIGGLFFQLCACCVTPATKRTSDILLMFLWICIIILLPFKDSKLLKADLQSAWFSIEYITQSHMITLFAAIVGFINVKPRSHESTLSKNMSFKKMESFTKNSSLPSMPVIASSHKKHSNSTVVNDSNETIVGQLTLSTSNAFAPLCVERPCSTPSAFQSLFTNQESQLSSTPVNDNTVSFNSSPLSRKNVTGSYSLNDSLSTLSILSLNEDKPKYTAKTPKVFERKVYGTKGSELFKKLNNISSKKSILSPPKLKSVTQASWVAGGFWQEGIDAPSLSRSSSQSSGFGSAGSNFAPSREPSVHEFDQYSVMSDMTQSCYTPKPNISPIGSYYQQSPQFSFVEPKHAMSNQMIKVTPNNLGAPQTLLLPPNYQKNNSVLMDQYLQGQNISDIKSASEIQQMFPSHTTIVTSPVWLPTLLCGSLVVNIIVLCTNFLR